MAPIDAVAEFVASFKQHLEDDKHAFRGIQDAIAALSRQVSDEARGLQDRIGQLENERIRRDAVAQYRKEQSNVLFEKQSLRANLGISRKAMWFTAAGVFVAFAGVATSAIIALTR